MRPLILEAGNLKRRYPRLEELKVEVGLQPKAQGAQSAQSEASTGPTSTHTATLCNLSPEGACVELEKAMVLRRRDWVVFSIKIEEKLLAIPARVAWASEERGVQRIGVKLRLELAPMAVRTRYARWIVNRVQTARRNGFE